MSVDVVTLAAAKKYAEKLALGGAIPIPGPAGKNGETPEFRMNGETLQYKYPTGTWTDLFTFSAGGIQSISNSEIQNILNNL